MRSVWEYKRYVPFISFFYCQWLVWGVCGEYCSKTEGGTTSYIECDYGCCGSSTDRECCTISTAVLIVACSIAGLVVVALIAAIAVCCYKRYKDKRETRIRQQRQQQADQQVLRRNVQPPKPPTYVSDPPEYSETMPESHYRPVTVNGRATPSNQRYNGRRNHQINHHHGPTAPTTRTSDMFSRHFVAATHTSGQPPTSGYVPTSGIAPTSGGAPNSSNLIQPTQNNPINNNSSNNTMGLSHVSSRMTPPPPYREVQTPAHAQRRQTINTQPSLPEEPETPSSDGSSAMQQSTQPQQSHVQRNDPLRQRVGTASQLPVSVQTPVSRGSELSRSTRVHRPQTDDSDIETLTIV